MVKLVKISPGEKYPLYGIGVVLALVRPTCCSLIK